VALLLVSLVLAACGGEHRVEIPADALLPERGVLFGAYVNRSGTWRGDLDAEQGVRDLEHRLGRRLTIDHHFYSWHDTFPGRLERWDRAAGRTPLITWEPFGVTLNDVAVGREDDLIRARAGDLARLKVPVFLRFGHEMNTSRYPWGGQPSIYVAAWRRIRAILMSAHAVNVAMVWCPNAEDAPDVGWNHWTRYYPGDDQVDWVGLDAYNFGSTQPWSRWRSLADLVLPVYRDYAGRRPIMIAETGTVEQGGDKARWLHDARRALRDQLPQVRAVVYFAAQPGWTPATSPGAFAAARELARDPHFSAEPRER
jgi:endoglucanase